MLEHHMWVCVSIAVPIVGELTTRLQFGKVSQEASNVAIMEDREHLGREETVSAGITGNARAT